MDKFFKRMILFSILLSVSAGAQNSSSVSSEELIERGRYIVKVTGCNDCHTPRYNERSGNVPEDEWLIGVGIGYKGPWGTTYATNIRRGMAQVTEEQWIRYAKTMKAKPPMPWFNVNAMSTEDLRAMYHFVRALGDSPNRVPEELKPGVQPKTPYINFVVVNPRSGSEHGSR